MTDLTTTNLKRLLDAATPGPWGARGNYKEGGPRRCYQHHARA
ncbi:hypothetical protein GCM10009604_04120 [Corynebacterium aurimucosum]